MYSLVYIKESSSMFCCMLTNEQVSGCMATRVAANPQMVQQTIRSNTCCLWCTIPVPNAEPPSQLNSAPHQHDLVLWLFHICVAPSHTAVGPWRSSSADCTGWRCWSGIPLHWGGLALGPFPVLLALLHMPLDHHDCDLHCSRLQQCDDLQVQI